MHLYIGDEMTESNDTTTNYRQSDCNNDDNPIDWFVVLNHQEEHADDEIGLFDNDDDNLTLFDLKPIPKFDHDLSIFDELAHQCDAVLLGTNLQQKTLMSTRNNNFHLSNRFTTTTMNDYERRFQRSLQKLTIPAWYADASRSSKTASKPLIISSNDVTKEFHRTPEIIHVHRPRSYRSCRSSLGTSPSPSVHSWHPNHMMDGMNFSLLPSSSSTSRRHNKYEKGIERVVKSSHWYQPTQFIPKKKTDRNGVSKISVNQQQQQQQSHYNHYDVPKVYFDNNESLATRRTKQYLVPDKGVISGLSIQQQEEKCLIDDIDFDDFKNTNAITQKSNNKGSSSITNDKQYDNYIKSNEFEKMSLINEKISFGRVEVEEVTDDEDNDKRSSTNKKHIPSTVEVVDSDNKTNTLLERIASNLVHSILSEALLSKDLDHEDDTNMGVRELSDDENALRELDENDMNGTDEFIVFATKSETSDHDDNEDQNNQASSVMPRGSLNRLYTFSRTNDDITTNPKRLASNQDSSTSVHTIVDSDISMANSPSNTDPIQPTNTMVHLDDNNNNSLPAYRSHIQKRNINLGRYYDGMMRATHSQLPTYDLRPNLILNKANDPNLTDGVNEETVRQGRLLLDSIPNTTDIKNQLNENVHNEETTPTRSILKNTRFTISDENNEKKTTDGILKLEEKNQLVPRKIITTITEEYCRIQRKIIEEIHPEFNDELYRNTNDITNQEQYNIRELYKKTISKNDESPYELLSECYSGYSYTRSDFLTPITNSLALNVSSMQSTTDEAYESEPTTTTISTCSPTMSSSPPPPTTTTTAHVHPDLAHEFEYPSPPPPIPDRRLKPAHLRPPPPPTKPRFHRQQQNSSSDYNSIKKSKVSPLTVIQHLLASPPKDSIESSMRTLSSRHYCGSLPIANEPITSSSSSSSNSQTKLKNNETSKRDSNTYYNNNSLNASANTDNNQKITLTKPTSLSLNKTKIRKPASAYFDEATNGLPIQLPAPMSQGYESINKQNLNRSSMPSSNKRVDRTTRQRPISESFNLDRSSIYETSV